MAWVFHLAWAVLAVPIVVVLFDLSRILEQRRPEILAASAAFGIAVPLLAYACRYSISFRRLQAIVVSWALTLVVEVALLAAGPAAVSRIIG
jgi:hypothetical protein